jgi:heme O synthase-like polyprenyltransferase
MHGAHAIEHGSTRSGRWLRERRLRFTLWIAAFEGLLYLFHALHWWAAVALAVVAVGFWWYAGRSSRSDTLRQISWMFAASQLLVLCVPIALALFKLLAIAVISVLAVVALFFVLRDRR